MYQGRSSNAQKKTRSPAPQTATPRSFLPPSYYPSVAAQSPIIRGDNWNGDQVSDRQDTRKTRRVSRNHPAVLSSDSSASSVEQHLRAKSRTPRTGFPDVETQLLPSLRETVDRMTLTPAWNPPYPQSTETDARQKVSRTGAKPAVASSSYLQSTPKPTLKSAMRSPVPTPTHTPKLQSPLVPQKSSLRSLLSRKCSGTLKSPFNNNKPSKEARELADDDFQSKTPTIQTRSRKNVDTNIPRPRTKPEIIHLDDSDLEHFYEANLRNRRKLTVANADVPPSSGSSVSDVESKRSLPVVNQPTPRRKWGKEHTSIGLGLTLPSAIPVPVQRTPTRKEERRMSQEKTLRFSLPLSESVGSSYSDDFNFSQPNRHCDTNYCADLNQRSSSNIRQSAQGRSPTLSTKAESTDYETESEREGYSVRRRRVGGDRRRSASCEARFSFAESSGSEDGAVPIVSRSRSMQRSPKPPSPRTTRIFPENLRDLIKSRNSLSNLAEVARTPTQASTRRSSPNTKSSKRERLKSPNPTAEFEGTPKASSSKIRQQERYCERQYESSRQGHSDASAIAYGYRSAAARERSAFGLPPSLSDDMRASTEDEQQLSQAESEMSSLNQTRWQDGESDKLSIDTESIFRSVRYKEKERYRTEPHSRRNAPRLSVISPTLSTTSSFDARSEAQPHEMPHQLTSQSNGQLHKDAPKTREGVIQEIFESEEELLRLFHICMRMFILPLRVQDSRTWIAGIPPNIAKLFDWFDDIVKLHELIYESLCSARDTMSPATDRVSETLRCFVLKVEVYQPYLVRLADVSTEITTLVDAHDTDLGEFVALQHRSRECEGWTLDRFLMLPVNRLAAYQDLFARMLDLTPKSHQDYLSTFSLSRSTDMVIRVMTEVKVREDEFNLLKAFSSRIQGLPFSSTLATRQRRLLHSGPLELVISGDSPSSVNSSPRARTGTGSRSDRGSRLLGTMSTSSSKIFEKYHSEQSASLGQVPCSQGASESTPAKEASSWFSRLRRQSRLKSPNPAPSQNANTSGNTFQSQAPPPARNPTLSVHAFVFNDLVLLAQPLRTSRAEPQWNVYEDLGVFRPLSIARLEVQKSGDTLVSLETMIVDPEFEHLADRIDFGPSSLRTVDFIISPACNKSLTDLRLDNDDSFFATWLDAFRQCSWSTLRKLTFPELSRLEGLSDHTVDTQLAISSLVGSGLPLPRSPSGTFPDMYSGADSAFRGDEREERGWWSLRYQQIFRELRRQDALLSEDEDTAGS